MISYAQNFEDVILWRVLKHIPNGYYVDVGAFHPEIDSVTKWFYDNGWTGINIEPVPASFAILDQARPRDRNLCIAAGAEARRTLMKVFPSSLGLSTLQTDRGTSSLPSEFIEVDVRPLNDVLEPGFGKAIHFLKIDAEMSEREVLQGIDFVRFRPWILVIEGTVPRSLATTTHPIPTAALWEDLVLSSGYRFAYFDGLNAFYVADEHADLANELSLPPNVFDDFELAALIRQRHECERLNTVIGDLQEQVVGFQRSLAILQEDKAALADAAKSARMRAETAESELSQSLLQLNQILNSRSWRWTEHLRRLRRAF